MSGSLGPPKPQCGGPAPAPAPACAPAAPQAALRAHTGDEDFRRHHPNHDLLNPRYKGINTNPGNVVFSNTAVSVPPRDGRFFPVPAGIEGFRKRVQHRMYQTSSHELGQPPEPWCLPVTHVPKSGEFTKAQAIGGNYVDMHLTTQLDPDPTISR